MPARAAPRSKSVILLGLFIAGILLATACSAAPTPTSRDMTAVPLDLPPGADPVGSASSPYEPHVAPPTTIRFERISVEQGLSESSVYCTFQDSQGFLWFCTADGLSKYDGQGFTVYRPDPDDNSISFNYVRSLCESPHGVLRIATLGGGLDTLDLNTGLFNHSPFTPDPSSQTSGWLTTLLCDSDGTVWVGSNGDGLSRLDPSTDQMVRHRYPGDLETRAQGTVNALYRDRDGALWIGTEGGLYWQDPTGQQITHFLHDPGNPHSLSSDSIRAILEDREGALWIGTGDGLDRFNRQQGWFDHYRYDPDAPGSLSHNSVQAIFEDREGVLWVGTEDGLNSLDRNSERFIRYQNEPADHASLSSNWIWSIFQDREGVLWFGTYAGGVNKYDRLSDRFAHYRTTPGDPNSLSDDLIWAIHEGGADGLWLGTGSKGLDLLDREQDLVINFRHDPDDPDSLSHNAVRALHLDQAGVLWIGTDGGGLDRLDPAQGDGQAPRFVHHRHDPEEPGSLSHDAIRVIYEDSHGVLWIGTEGGGLNRLDSDTGRFVHYMPDSSNPGSLQSASVWSVAEDREGTLWFGTAGVGLHRFDRRTEQFTAYTRDPSDIVMSIHQDRWGSLWLATYGNGLYRFDPEAEAFTLYGIEDGLPSNAVFGILEDERGTLWLSTNNGLANLDPQTGTFKNYDVSDGLQSREFAAGAYHQGGDGELFFGGINGFNAFHPDRIQESNPYVPPVVLTSLTQDGEPLNTGAVASSLRAFTLEWPENHFEFEFAALSFSHPDKNQHAYMLEGFDRDWIQLGTQRHGRYTNLPGGSYTLRLRGSNGEGIWNDQGTAIQVTVVPPFWQTWAFRILLLGALVTGGVVIYRQRIRSIEARSRQLERQVDERTHEVERRRRVAEALRDILAVINSDRPLDEVLDYIVNQADWLLGAGATVLHQIEEERQLVTIQASSGLPEELASTGAIPYDATWVDEAIHSRQPHAIPDLEKARAGTGPETDPEARRWLEVICQHYQSFLAVPLIVEGQVEHGLAFYYAEPQAFSDEQIGTAISLADQAALAIENARLHESAKELAAVDERQRLARDLHDAVSQNLFSASLIAETLPVLWKDSPEEAEQLLDKLRQLNRGALAEMRGLLMELRPAALVEASMVDLLQQLGQAVSGREGIPVTVLVDEPCSLPADVHVALYRIAQEALNNVVKHAQASQVEVSLHCLRPDSQQASSTFQIRRGEEFTLRIRDDGLGFDPPSASQERLGLGIMRERAQSVGASLEIESQVGRGTLVTVVWARAVRKNMEDE